MFSLFIKTEAVKPLIVPDSVQKANLIDTLDRVVNMDYRQLLMNLASDAVWIVLKILLALAIYAIGRWFIRRVVRLMDAAFERRSVDPSLRLFLRNMVKVVLSIILLLSVVQALGVNITSIIALFASATLAIGMALSGTAQNFAGGVMILLMKPYRVGDFIEAHGQSGTVQEIKLFSTVITTYDHQTIYIPNNTIATAIIDNYSTSETRRVEWKIGISYGDDVDVARKVILDLFIGDDRIILENEPAPVVLVKSLADSSVILSARVWVKTDDFWGVFYEYNEKIYKALPQNGIHFPFPQLDVHLKTNSKL